jgi:hypothetical protein
MPDSYWIQKARRHLWNLSQRFKSGISCSAGCERSFTEQNIRLTRNRKTSYAEEFDMCLDLSFGIGPFFLWESNKNMKGLYDNDDTNDGKSFRKLYILQKTSLKQKKGECITFTRQKRNISSVLLQQQKKSAIFFMPTINSPHKTLI